MDGFSFKCMYQVAPIPIPVLAKWDTVAMHAYLGVSTARSDLDVVQLLDPGACAMDVCSCTVSPPLDLCYSPILIVAVHTYPVLCYSSIPISYM